MWSAIDNGELHLLQQVIHHGMECCDGPLSLAWRSRQSLQQLMHGVLQTFCHFCICCTDDLQQHVHKCVSLFANTEGYMHLYDRTLCFLYRQMNTYCHANLAIPKANTRRHVDNTAKKSLQRQYPSGCNIPHRPRRRPNLTFSIRAGCLFLKASTL